MVPAKDGGFRVQAASLDLSKPAVVWVVGYDRDVVKEIGGGENDGRTITYSNVVREWRNAGRWSGSGPLDIAFKRPEGDGGVAVIVQEGEVGPVLGAANITY